MPLSRERRSRFLEAASERSRRSSLAAACYAPTMRILPGSVPATASRICGTRGRRSSIRLLCARISTTPMVCAASPVRSRAKSTGTDSSRRTRTGHYLVAGVFERRDGLFAPHRRELMQKLLKAIAGFEIVEQRLNGNARAHEHGRAAEPIWVAMNHVFREPQSSRHTLQCTLIGLERITIGLSCTWHQIGAAQPRSTSLARWLLQPAVGGDGHPRRVGQPASQYARALPATAQLVARLLHDAVRAVRGAQDSATHQEWPAHAAILRTVVIGKHPNSQEEHQPPSGRTSYRLRYPRHTPRSRAGVWCSWGRETRRPFIGGYAQAHASAGHGRPLRLEQAHTAERQVAQ